MSRSTKKNLKAPLIVSAVALACFLIGFLPATAAADRDVLSTNDEIVVADPTTEAPATESTVPETTENTIEETTETEATEAATEATEATEAIEENLYTETYETVYAISGVNVRTGAGTSNDKVGVLNQGDKVIRIGLGSNGWSKVIYNGQEAFVSSKYLTTEAPKSSVSATTKPPVTEPPVTEPPATEPPATEPPATEPPATEPPATEPAPTEPVQKEETKQEETKQEETKKEEPVHTHTYNEKYVEGDCYVASYTEYRCDCGDRYVETGSVKGHNFIVVQTVAPTTVSKGYDVIECEHCHTQDKTNWVDMIEQPKEEDVVIDNGDVAPAETHDESEPHNHVVVTVGCYTYIYCENVNSIQQGEDDYTVLYPYYMY